MSDRTHSETPSASSSDGEAVPDATQTQVSLGTERHRCIEGEDRQVALFMQEARRSVCSPLTSFASDASRSLTGMGGLGRTLRFPESWMRTMAAALVSDNDFTDGAS